MNLDTKFQAMSLDTQRGLLSDRARAVAIKSKDNLIWDVLNDLWDADKNPGGFVSLGVAENALMHEELLAYLQKPQDITVEAFTYGSGPKGSKRCVVDAYYAKSL